MVLPQFLRIFLLNQDFSKVKYPQNTHTKLFYLNFNILLELSACSLHWYLYRGFQKYRWSFSYYHQYCYLTVLPIICWLVNKIIWWYLLKFSMLSNSLKGCSSYLNSILHIFSQRFHKDFLGIQGFQAKLFNFWTPPYQLNLVFFYEDMFSKIMLFQLPCIISFWLQCNPLSALKIL